MELINTSLRLLIVSQLLLFTLMVVVSSANPIRVRVVSVLFVVSVLSYLLMPIAEPYINTENIHFLWYPSNIAPSMLLLLVWFTFEEKSTVPPWLVLLVSFSVLSSFWFRMQNIGLPDTPLWLQASKIVIAIVTVVIVWLGRECDLIETRSKVRSYMVFTLCFMTLAIITVDILADFNTMVYLDFIEFSLMFIFSLIGNYLFIRLNPAFQLMQPEPEIKTESEDKVIVELLDRMKRERLYSDHDLRVASLAAMLNVPEYKLRNKINQQLGYRNFNQFVNQYRIDEASERLLADSRMPVLSIALDVGFRSISSFNTAFQQQFGVSPTQYRNQNS